MWPRPTVKAALQGAQVPGTWRPQSVAGRAERHGVVEQGVAGARRHCVVRLPSARRPVRLKSLRMTLCVQRARRWRWRGSMHTYVTTDGAGGRGAGLMQAVRPWTQAGPHHSCPSAASSAAAPLPSAGSASAPSGASASAASCSAASSAASAPSSAAPSGAASPG